MYYYVIVLLYSLFYYHSSTICTTYTNTTYHFYYISTLLHCTVSVHNVLPHCIHEGLSVTFLIVWCGVYICIECYENIENRLPVCQFLICIYWFYSILSVMVDYKYLKMYYFDLFPVFQWEWAVFWPGTRKAKMGLKTEKAISTKKKLNFI